MTTKIQAEREVAKMIMEQFDGVGIAFSLQLISDMAHIVNQFANGEKNADAHFARKILKQMENICWCKDLAEKKMTQDEFLKKIDERALAEGKKKAEAFKKRLDKKMKPKKRR